MCGFAVEWLRSCYVSTWRLGSDSAQLTAGRYVFCPEGTPHFEDWHPFGSRNWSTDDFKNGPPVNGEARGTRQQWSNGLSPNPFPFARQIGDPAAMIDGIPFDGICEWSLAADNGSGWTNVDDVVRWTAEDSANCGGPNSQVQDGVATRKLATSFPRYCNVRLTFNVEKQNAGFDVCNVTLDGVRFAHAEGLNDGEGCAMYGGEVTGQIVVLPGAHTLEVSCDTVDAQYHVGLFFEAEFTFDPPFEPNDGDVYQGFPLLCYVPSVEPLPTIPPPLDIDGRLDQAAAARVIDALYTDFDLAVALLQQRLGDTAVITGLAPSASITPGFLIAVRPDLVVIIIAGTSNEEQVLSYVLNVLTGAVDTGEFKTNATWFAAAIDVQTAVLASGADPNARVQLVGHSYGGAVAAVMAARYRLAAEDRAIDVLSFGAPKPGDLKFRAILERCRVARLMNAGDPIPGLPPALKWALPYISVLPGALVTFWDQLVQCLGGVLVDVDGRMVDDEVPFFDVAYWILAVAWLLGGTFFPLPIPHRITEYLRRIELRND